jgi:hypothetical protein
MSAIDDDPGSSYPRGGTSTSSGGQGILVDPETEDPLEIWVDLAIPDRMGLIRQLQVGFPFVGFYAPSRRHKWLTIHRHHRLRGHRRHRLHQILSNPARPQESSR